MKTDPNGSAFTGPSMGYNGLTKREFFAAVAMHALIASGEYKDASNDVLACDATLYSDALIDELNKD